MVNPITRVHLEACKNNLAVPAFNPKIRALANRTLYLVVSSLPAYLGLHNRNKTLVLGCSLKTQYLVNLRCKPNPLAKCRCKWVKMLEEAQAFTKNSHSTPSSSAAFNSTFSQGRFRRTQTRTNKAHNGTSTASESRTSFHVYRATCSASTTCKAFADSRRLILSSRPHKNSVRLKTSTPCPPNLAQLSTRKLVALNRWYKARSTLVPVAPALSARLRKIRCLEAEFSNKIRVVVCSVKAQ